MAAWLLAADCHATKPDELAKEIARTMPRSTALREIKWKEFNFS
jgi:hypothetical protein